MSAAIMRNNRRGFLILAGLLTACTRDTEPSFHEDVVPRLAVMHTKRAPKLDGWLGEPVWSFASATGDFVETRSGRDAPFRASAKLLWDEGYLYVGVEVHDTFLRASYTKHDDHLWEQDCVELMIDPDGDGSGYFEIQVSPRGVVFDTRYDSRRIPGPFGHVDWDSSVRIGVSRRGHLDDSDADDGYAIEMAIPWQAFSLRDKPLRAPAIGHEMRANLYVMDLSEERQRAAAWSPVGISDFHVPHRFGILALQGASSAIDAQALESPGTPH